MHNPIAAIPVIAIPLIVILYSPLVYFGLLLLLDPVRFVPFLSSVMEGISRFNFHLQGQQWLREPAPIRDSLALRTGLRLAGIAILVFGLSCLFAVL